MSENTDETDLSEGEPEQHHELFYELAVTYAKLGVHPDVPRWLRWVYTRRSCACDRKWRTAGMVTVRMTVVDHEKWVAAKYAEARAPSGSCGVASQAAG